MPESTRVPDVMVNDVSKVCSVIRSNDQVPVSVKVPGYGPVAVPLVEKLTLPACWSPHPADGARTVVVAVRVSPSSVCALRFRMPDAANAPAGTAATSTAVTTTVATSSVTVTRRAFEPRAVSYTHLTLPTIYSV